MATGVVTSYDERIGIGAVTDAADGDTYMFHCTQITDGTRTIPVGAAVTFDIRTDRPKGPEAYAVTER